MLVTVTFDGEPKEIAALAQELREQREKVMRPSSAQIAEELKQHLQDQNESGQIWS